MESQQALIFIHYTALVLVTLVISLGFSAFLPMNSKIKRIYLSITLGIFAFMTMFRAETVGNDTLDYIQTFNLTAHSGDILAFINDSAIEPGYLAWNWIISCFIDKPQALFIVSGLVFYLSLGRFVNKWMPAPGLVIYALVAMHLFDGYLSTMRQTLALAILLFAFDFAYSKKPLPFILLCLFATQFHMAAFLFLFVYPIKNVNPTFRTKASKVGVALLVVGAVGIAMFAFDNILSFLMDVFPKYQYYLGGKSVDGETRLATLLNIAVYSLMLIIPKLMKSRNVEFSDEKAVATFKRLSLFNIIILVLSMNATIFTRFTGLFTLFSTGDYSTAVARLERREHILFVLLSVLLLYAYGLVIALLKTPEWYTTYPYSFFWM